MFRLTIFRTSTIFKRLNQLIFALLIFSSAAYSQNIVKWKDQDGKIHYGETLPNNAEKQPIKNRVSEYTPDKQYTAKHPKVVMYSTKTCGYCKKARAFMHKNNIAFVEYDVDQSRKAEQEYRALGGTGVPFIVIGEEKIRGFQPSKIKYFYSRERS